MLPLDCVPLSLVAESCKLYSFQKVIYLQALDRFSGQSLIHSGSYDTTCKPCKTT